MRSSKLAGPVGFLGNKDLLSLMLSVDFCRSKLKQGTPEINDYSIKGEKT